MAKFEIITYCPVHPTQFTFTTIEALHREHAKKRAVGTIVHCPLKDRYKITEENIVSVAPIREVISRIRPPGRVPPPPAEKMYFVIPEVAERLSRKLEWWKR